MINQNKQSNNWNQQTVVNRRSSRPRIQHQTVRKDLVGGLPNMFNPSFLLELAFQRERERENEGKKALPTQSPFWQMSCKENSVYRSLKLNNDYNS